MIKPIAITHFRRVVFFSALYDLLLTAPFATPWSFAAIRTQLTALNQALGGAALPDFAAFPLLMANLLGSIVIVWSVLRLRHPEPLLGRYDGTARFLFSTWMAWTLHATGQPVLWLFLIPEFAWGIIQWWPVSGGKVSGWPKKTADATAY